MMINKRNNVAAVLDVGSTKIVCMIAKFMAPGELEVIGVGCHSSSGIKGGIITDLQLAVDAIIHAVEAAEKSAGLRINKVYLSISSNNLISQQVTTSVDVTGYEISAKNINKLILQSIDRYKDQLIGIIHSFICDYSLDGNRGITSPLGMYGNTLSADIHILAASSNTLANFTNCIAKCQIEVKGYIAASYATALASLTQDEMDLGIALIECGGGCTTISIFNNKQLIYTDGVPIGGTNITNDIARGLCTDFYNAERIKTLYGTVIFSNADAREIIEVPFSSEHEGEFYMVKRSMLVEIIRARIEEILELLWHKLRRSGFEAYANKVVISGAGCQLNGIKELITQMFAAKVRMSNSSYNIVGLADGMQNHTFTTAIGMLLYIMQHMKHEAFFKARDSGSKSFLEWLRDCFIT